ncbi:hypothetical protein [Sphingomicrobium aestuariivivum]|nr:hypothetical protein [Sphingomicrobium aestuariivivum]MCJ8191888.1 hypothetical protein [Sphingomicrobium aestuariivivum]
MAKAFDLVDGAVDDVLTIAGDYVGEDGAWADVGETKGFGLKAGLRF